MCALRVERRRTVIFAHQLASPGRIVCATSQQLQARAGRSSCGYGSHHRKPGPPHVLLLRRVPQRSRASIMILRGAGLRFFSARDLVGMGSPRSHIVVGVAASGSRFDWLINFRARQPPASFPRSSGWQTCASSQSWRCRRHSARNPCSHRDVLNSSPTATTGIQEPPGMKRLVNWTGRQLKPDFHTGTARAPETGGLRKRQWLNQR